LNVLSETWRYRKAQFTQYWDKEIRYCNKKIKRHFSSNFSFFLCELKIFIFGQFCSTDVNGYKNLYTKLSLMPLVWKDFEMQLQYFDKKKYFYLFIAISSYLFISIFCAKMSRVNKALEGDRWEDLVLGTWG